jgi:protein SERAC1
MHQVIYSTHGIAFLGTPHQGADPANTAGTFARLANIIKPTAIETSRVLQPASEVLAGVSGDFHTMLKARELQKTGPIGIVCFFESLPMSGVGMVSQSLFPSPAAYPRRDDRQIYKGQKGLMKIFLVQIVPKQSAIRSGYLSRSIHANRRDMTKSQDRRDDEFLAVANTLARWSKNLVRAEGDEHIWTAAAAQAQAPAPQHGSSILHHEIGAAPEPSAPQ